MLNIKKLTRAAALLAISALIFHHSASHAAPVSFGLKGLMGMDKYSAQAGGTTIPTEGFKFGTFGGGAVLDIGLGPVGLQVEGLYNIRKADQEAGVTLTSKEFRVPALIYFEVMPIRLMLGGFYAAAHGDLKATVGGVDIDIPHANAGFEKNDYGVATGLGVVIPAGAFRLTVEGRYNHGLKNISTINGLEIKTRSIEVLAGILF